jgi:hypothetical protein
MQTLFDSRLSVKSDPSFRALPSRGRRMPYTRADLDWAAQFSGDLEDNRELEERNRELEERALLVQWDDQFISTVPATGHCLLCGDRCDDLTVHGLCDRYDDLACEAAIKGENARAGLGYRVF